MRSISDKYIAGFLDGDGSIYVNRGRLWLEFLQRVENDGVLHLIREVLGGGSMYERRSVAPNGTVSIGSRLVYTGQRAVDILCRLKGHLVVRRARAQSALVEVGFQERVGTLPLANHPSRKWLAGYFDSDGCLYAGWNKGRTTSASVRIQITEDKAMRDGLTLVRKAFEGSIYEYQNKLVWQLTLDAAKAKKVLGYFAEHLLVKREQAYFILGCARMGHFRDGDNIVPILKAMKTHSHRVSDLTAEVDVSEELSRVRDLQPEAGRRYVRRDGQNCSTCGSDELYAKGMCNPCWQRTRYAGQKRYSEQQGAQA